MAIARDIVAAHQGTLIVDDLAEGVAMRISLLAADASSYDT